MLDVVAALLALLVVLEVVEESLVAVVELVLLDELFEEVVTAFVEVDPAAEEIPEPVEEMLNWGE